MASHRPPDVSTQNHQDGVRRARLNSFPPRRYSFEALLPCLNVDTRNSEPHEGVQNAAIHSCTPIATAQITLDDGEREYFHADTLGEKLIHADSVADGLAAIERSNSFPSSALSFHRKWDVKANTKSNAADEEPVNGPQHANGRIPSPTSASSRVTGPLSWGQGQYSRSEKDEGVESDHSKGIVDDTTNSKSGISEWLDVMEVRIPSWASNPGEQRTEDAIVPQQPNSDPVMRRWSCYSEEKRIGSPSPSESCVRNWTSVLLGVKEKLIANNGKGRKITIVCGGLINVTYEKTLRRYPGTLLTSLVTDPSGILFNQDKLVLDRHPLAFVEILNSYREGVLPLRPPHLAPETWINELQHFSMHRADIPGIKEMLARYDTDSIVERPGKPKKGLRRKVWTILEEPSSSLKAWLLSFLSLVLIVSSVCLVCIETLPEVQSSPISMNVVRQMDFSFVMYFLMEFLLRFFLNENKIAFMKDLLNILDVIAILPSLVMYFLEDTRGIGGTKLVRVLRVLRIFKLTRHSDGLIVLWKTAAACRSELGLLLFCMIVFSLLFSALLYYSEMDSSSTPSIHSFSSIPDTMWWAIVTITTVGYGDMVPRTGVGKLFGSICAILGVVMVALPISVISSTFNEIFREHAQLQKVRSRRLLKKKQITRHLRAKFISTRGREWAKGTTEKRISGRSASFDLPWFRTSGSSTSASANSMSGAFDFIMEASRTPSVSQTPILTAGKSNNPPSPLHSGSTVQMHENVAAIDRHS
mmetsp:Transcript_14870/g.34195  ORF Transcript_14870/g.34195 Transcript_14870/m.34195 type:complete len:756 (-) Transcript_14870:131-2398(-)